MSREDLVCMLQGAGFVAAALALGAAFLPLIQAAGLVLAAVQAVMGWF